MISRAPSSSRMTVARIGHILSVEEKTLQPEDPPTQEEEKAAHHGSCLGYLDLNWEGSAQPGLSGHQIMPLAAAGLMQLGLDSASVRISQPWEGQKCNRQKMLSIFNSPIKGALVELGVLILLILSHVILLQRPFVLVLYIDGNDDNYNKVRLW